MKIILTLAYILLSFSLCGQGLTIVYDDWYPYCYTNEHGDAEGLDVEVSEFILGLMGYDVNFVRKDWDECINDVKENKVDGILSLLKTDERLTYLQYPKIYLSYAQSRFYALDSKGNYKTLGIVVGYEYTDVVYKNNLTQIKFQTPEDLLTAFFDDKEIDVIYEDNLYITEEAEKRGVTIYPVTKYSVNTTALKESKPDLIYIAFSKRFPKKDVAKFNEMLKQFRGSLMHRKIIEKYTNYRLYRNVLNSTAFYIPMLFISGIGILLLLLAYRTIKYNHFNFQSLLFILVGAVIVSMGDLLSVFADYIFYIKILGMLVLSYGIYKVMQKYWNTYITAALYVITVCVGFGLSYYFNSISIVYYTVALLGFYLIAYNIYEKGIDHCIMINSASAFYILFSVIVGISRQDLMPYDNVYAVFFAIGYILQLLSTFKKEF